MKFKVGDKLFFVRTDRNGGPGKPEECTVLAVGRKWVRTDVIQDARFDPETMEGDGRGYASPGKYYRRIEDYREERRRDAAWRALGQIFDSRPPRPPSRTLEYVARILGFELVTLELTPEEQKRDPFMVKLGIRGK